MEIKIYTLNDPITNEVRYVGKTKKSLTKRLYEHSTKRNLTSNTYKNNWIKKLINLGLRPIIKTIEIVNEDNWIEREMFWIKYYKELGTNLTNATDGGEGTTTFKMPREAVEKSIATKKLNNYKCSDETKQRISDSKKGRKNTKEQNEAIVSKTRYTILQCDLEGNLINEWVGIRQCAKALNFNHSTICKAIRLNRPYYGYIWKNRIIKERKKKN